MNDYLLDTDILIWYLRGREDIVELVRTLATSSILACSAVSVLEIQAGVREGEKEQTNALLEGLRVEPVDRDIANKAGQYIRTYRRQGITIGFADSLIASTAVARNLILVTENRDDYPMPDVRLHPAN